MRLGGRPHAKRPKSQVLHSLFSLVYCHTSDFSSFSSFILFLKVKLSGKTLNGAEFEPEHQLEFVIGDEQVSEGLEAAISSLKKGQKARFTFKPHYAFGAPGDATRGVPANATVVYEIEMVDFVKEKESWDMTPEEKMTAAQKRKDDGNECFKVTLSLSTSSSLEQRILCFFAGIQVQESSEEVQEGINLFGRGVWHD